MLVPAVRPEVFNLSSLSVSESSSQAAQPIPWAHLMVALAGSPTLLACGRLFLLTWLCIWSNVVGSSDSTQIGRRKRGSVQIQDCICSSLHAHEISSRGAQGRRLGWNIAAVAEQISCEYLPKKTLVRTSFTGPAPEGQTSISLRTWMEKVTLLPLDRLFFSTSFLWRTMSPQSRHCIIDWSRTKSGCWVPNFGKCSGSQGKPSGIGFAGSITARASIQCIDISHSTAPRSTGRLLIENPCETSRRNTT